MPGRNGTGPMGYGPMSGRGLGKCTGVNAVRKGAGAGAGLGRGYDFETNMSQKELLTTQKEAFQRRLDIINKQLNNLTE